jgi:hypothetical protein
MQTHKKTDILGWLSSSKHPILDLAKAHGITYGQIAVAIDFRPENPTTVHETYFRALFNGWAYLGERRVEAVRELLLRAGAKSEVISHAIMCTRAMMEKKYRVTRHKVVAKSKAKANKIVPFNP